MVLKNVEKNVKKSYEFSEFFFNFAVFKKIGSEFCENIENHIEE